MKLDIKTGDVWFADKLHISLGISFSQMKNLYPKAKIWDVTTGYFWLNFEDICIDENLWQVSVCYFQEQLVSIHFSFRHQYEKPFSWEDWTEESQLTLKKRFEKWILENVGEQTQFPWGNIGAYYNPKDSLAIMIIQYKNPPASS